MIGMASMMRKVLCTGSWWMVWRCPWLEWIRVFGVGVKLGALR